MSLEQVCLLDKTNTDKQSTLYAPLVTVALIAAPPGIKKLPDGIFCHDSASGDTC